METIPKSGDKVKITTLQNAEFAQRILTQELFEELKKEILTNEVTVFESGSAGETIICEYKFNNKIYFSLPISDVEPIKIKEKIYICGPVSTFGNLENNIKALNECFEVLKALNFEPILSTNLDRSSIKHILKNKQSTEQQIHKAWMSICLPALLECTSIVYLDNFMKSVGARMEFQTVQNYSYNEFVYSSELKEITLIEKVNLNEMINDN